MVGEFSSKVAQSPESITHLHTKLEQHRKTHGGIIAAQFSGVCGPNCTKVWAVVDVRETCFRFQAASSILKHGRHKDERCRKLRPNFALFVFL